MIELTIVDDLRKNLNFSSAKAGQSEEGDKERIDNFVVVGEESNGRLIYAWNEISLVTSGETVTHIGVYDRQTRSNKLIYTCHKCVKIVNATISQEESFLAFVTLEPKRASTNGADLYSANLAEIRPSHRLFSLALESPAYILLQFLYTNENNFSGFNSLLCDSHKVHLLVIRHLEAIGVYHLSASRVRDEGWVMNAEPEKERILQKGIVWAEWNMIHKRLYAVQLKKQHQHSSSTVLSRRSSQTERRPLSRNQRSSKATSRQLSQMSCASSDSSSSIHPSLQPEPVLFCFQFNEDGSFTEFMRLILDLPISLSKSRLKYIDVSPLKYIPVSNVQLRVLEHDVNASMCICYQHVSSSAKTKSLEVQDKAISPIHYSVISIHHNKKFEATLERAIPTDSCITFAWLDDYLLIHLSDQFTHLLNVGRHTEPVFHVLWQASSRDHAQQSPSAKVPLTVINAKTHLGLELYNAQSRCVYKATVSDDELAAMFTQSKDMKTRLSIMHYAVACSLSLVRKVFETIQKSSCFSDMSLFFQEYLVGSTFERIRHQTDGQLLRGLPFTCSNIFSVKSIQEKKYTYEPVLSLEGVALSPGHPLSGWSTVSPKREPIQRFDLSSVRRVLTTKSTSKKDKSVETDANEPLSKHVQKLNLNRRKSKMTTGGMNPTGGGGGLSSSQTEQVLGKTPTFARTSPDSMMIADNKVMLTTVKMLVFNMKGQFPTQSSVKINQIANEYVRCQLRSSRKLLHILWSVCGLNQEEENNSLGTPPLKCELDLVRLLECYQFVTGRLSFPQPLNFSLHFASLLFRCKQRIVFLQHLDFKVIAVDLPFCLRVIKELDDSDENVKLKSHLIQRLKQTDRIKSYRTWGHPFVTDYVMQSYVSKCIASGETLVLRNILSVNGSSSVDNKDAVELDFTASSSLSEDGEEKKQSNNLSPVPFWPLKWSKLDRTKIK